MAAAAVAEARPAVPEGDDFVAAFRALGQTDRIYVKRMARTGRRFPADERELARLGVGYARFQLGRPWMRLFWAWAPVALVLAFSSAVRVHELAAGMVLGAGFLAWNGRRGLRKAVRVNREVVGG